VFEKVTKIASAFAAGLILLATGSSAWGADGRMATKYDAETGWPCSEIIETHLFAHFFDVKYFYRDGGEGALRELKNGATLYSGDHYKIEFETKQKSYVYIFQLDSSGRVFKLFPMDNFNGKNIGQTNPVMANVRYTLPKPDMAFILDEQTGQETIYFVAFPEPRPELEKHYAALEFARTQNKTAEADLLQKQLVREFKKRGLGGVVEDPDPQAGRKNPQNAVYQFDHLLRNCMSAVTFEHR